MQRVTTCASVLSFRIGTFTPVTPPRSIRAFFVVVALAGWHAGSLSLASGDVPVFQQLPLLNTPPGAPYIGDQVQSTVSYVGSPATSATVSDDFELSTSAPLTSVTWWGAPLQTPDPHFFSIDIFANVAASGNVPSHPGASVAFATFAELGYGVGTPPYNVTGVADPGIQALFEKYDATFLTPIVLQANTVYWLSIVAEDVTLSENALNWGWQTRDYTIPDPHAPGDTLVGNVGGLPVYGFGASAVTYSYPTGGTPPANPVALSYQPNLDGPAGIGSFGKDMAFALYATPEPSTLVLLAIGAFGLLAVGRGGRRGRTTTAHWATATEALAVFACQLARLVRRSILGRVRRLSACVAVVALGCYAAQAAATEYHVTEIPGAAVGINSMGQVAAAGGTWTPTSPNATTGTVAGTSGVAINDYGQTTYSTGFSGGFPQDDWLFTPSVPNGVTGSTTFIDSVGDDDLTVMRAISDEGAVAGELNSGVTSALIWIPSVPNGKTGQVFGMQIGDGFSTTAYGINDLRQVVGHEIDETHAYAGAFLFTPTHYLGNTAAGVTTMLSGDTAFAVNNVGQVVSAGNNTAYLFTPTVPNGTTGSTIALGLLPGAIASVPTSLNDLGQVVGNSSSNAFLWTSSGGMVNLNNFLDPVSGAGWTLQNATGINDAGQIVGTGTLNGITQGFLLTPVPEPATIVLAAIGGLAFVALRQR